MKIVKRTYLPDSVKYNKKTYQRNVEKSALHTLGKLKRDDRQHCIIVKVLPRSLHNKTDLHGRPYLPTEWIFESTRL